MENNEAIKLETIDLAGMLKVLSDPNRLLLLDKIINGIQCNCELGASLSLAPNLVSHHLAKLCEIGLVTPQRDKNDARWIHYSVNEAVLTKLHERLYKFTDPSRIQLPQSICPPYKKPQPAVIKTGEHFGSL